MELIITSSIKKKEYRITERVIGLEVLKRAAEKSLNGLGIVLKNPVYNTKALVVKVYITTNSSAARAVFLIQTRNKKSVLAMIRLKKDKIGSNMTMRNREFKKVLETNIVSILKDLREGKFERYSLK